MYVVWLQGYCTRRFRRQYQDGNILQGAKDKDGMCTCGFYHLRGRLQSGPSTTKVESGLVTTTSNLEKFTTINHI